MKGIGSRWILLPSPMAVRDTFISCLNCKSLKPKTESSEIMEYTTNNTWFPLRTRLETRVPITDCKERTLGATASSCRVPGPSPFRAVAAVKSEWDCIQLISGSEGENSVLFTMNMTLLSLHKDEARELMEKFWAQLFTDLFPRTEWSKETRKMFPWGTLWFCPPQRKLFTFLQTRKLQGWTNDILAFKPYGLLSRAQITPHVHAGKCLWIPQT